MLHLQDPGPDLRVMHIPVISIINIKHLIKDRTEVTSMKNEQLSVTWHQEAPGSHAPSVTKRCIMTGTTVCTIHESGVQYMCPRILPVCSEGQPDRDAAAAVDAAYLHYVDDKPWPTSLR